MDEDLTFTATYRHSEGLTVSAIYSVPAEDPLRAPTEASSNWYWRSLPLEVRDKALRDARFMFLTRMKRSGQLTEEQVQELDRC